MATYKSEEIDLRTSAEKVFAKLSNLENLGELMKNVPEGTLDEEKKKLLEQVEVTPDTITFPGGPAGMVKLRKVEAVEPTLIKMEGVGTPVPMAMSLHVTPINDSECRAQVEINIEVPAMIKPMINGPMKKMAQQVGEMLRYLND